MRRLIAGYASAVLVGAGILGSAGAVALGANAIFAPSSFAASFTCNDYVSVIPSGTTINGSLSVPSGAQCTLDNVTVTGSVIVNPGAISLITQNFTTIDGYVTSSGAQAIQMVQTTVKGSINAQNTNSGNPPASSRIACSTVKGSINVSGSSTTSYWNINDLFGYGACAPGAGNIVGGSINFTNNAGGGDISVNTIGSALMCNNNSSAVNLFSGSNDETNGGKEPDHGLFGQCATFD